MVKVIRSDLLVPTDKEHLSEISKSFYIHKCLVPTERSVHNWNTHVKYQSISNYHSKVITKVKVNIWRTRELQNDRKDKNKMPFTLRSQGHKTSHHGQTFCPEYDIHIILSSNSLSRCTIFDETRVIFFVTMQSSTFTSTESQKMLWTRHLMAVF
jgi:hypothetical protein